MRRLSFAAGFPPCIGSPAQHEALARGLWTEPARLLTAVDVGLRIRRMQTAPGSSVRLTGDTVTSPRGSQFKLQVKLAYTSPSMAATLMLAGVPKWGHRTTNSLELGPFAPPIRDGTRFTPVEFTSPARTRSILSLSHHGRGVRCGAHRIGDGLDRRGPTVVRRERSRRLG